MAMACSLLQVLETYPEQENAGFDVDIESGIKSFDVKRLQETKLSPVGILDHHWSVLFLEITDLIDVIPRLSERRFQL